MTQVVTQPSDLSKGKYNVNIRYNVCESLHIEKIQAQKCGDDVFAVLTIQVSVLLGGNDNDSDKGAWPRKILKPEFHFLNSDVVHNAAQTQTTTITNTAQERI